MRAQLEDVAVATATAASSTGFDAGEDEDVEAAENELLAVDRPLPCNPVSTRSPLLDKSEGGGFVEESRPSIVLLPKKDMLALNCGWYGLVMSNLSDTSSLSDVRAAGSGSPLGDVLAVVEN